MLAYRILLFLSVNKKVYLYAHFPVILIIFNTFCIEIHVVNRQNVFHSVFTKAYRSFLTISGIMGLLNRDLNLRLISSTLFCLVLICQNTKSYPSFKTIPSNSLCNETEDKVIPEAGKSSSTEK